MTKGQILPQYEFGLWIDRIITDYSPKNIVEIGTLEGRFAHYTYNADGAKYNDENNDFPVLNQKANFCFDNTIEFVNGLIKN